MKGLDLMSPWDECICGHDLAEHGADPDGADGCVIPECPCPWFDHDRVCAVCGFGYGCDCEAA